MSIKSSSRELFWGIAGALGLVIVFFIAIFLRGNSDPAAQIAFKEKLLALVNAMRLSLAAASEAQNSAVLSISEQDSKTFAEEARKANADLERGRIELTQLLKTRADSHQTQLMDRVAQSLEEFQHIDKQLMDLALESSNRKAFGLAFGPAMKLLGEMDEPLSLIVANATSAQPEHVTQLVRLAGEVRVGMLRIQVLLLPHIAEASDQKMDEFERELASIDQNIRENLNAISPILPDGDNSKLETVKSRLADFEDIKSQIIKLSRQNSNVRAAAIALKDKRKAMLACQDALVALENAIRAEPISSAIPSGRSSQ